MSTAQGLAGSITMPTGYNMKHASFDLDHSTETVDTSGFEDNGFRTREPVVTSFTGSTAGTLEWDASNTAPLPSVLADGSAMAATDLSNAQGTLTMQVVTGCTIAATCNVTGFSASRSFDGKADASYNFESTGPITQSWDETP